MSTQTVNIAIDKQLLREIDQAVKQDLGSRSEYFRRLAIIDLDRRKRWNDILSLGKEVGNKMGITSEEQVYRIIKDHGSKDHGSKDHGSKDHGSKDHGSKE
ncbi:MAG: hypothetical protein ACYDBX_00160 [Patescibacteria group bacterium]